MIFNLKVYFCNLFRIFNFELIDSWYQHGANNFVYRCRRTGIEKCEYGVTPSEHFYTNDFYFEKHYGMKNLEELRSWERKPDQLLIWEKVKI